MSITYTALERSLLYRASYSARSRQTLDLYDHGQYLYPHGPGHARCVCLALANATVYRKDTTQRKNEGIISSFLIGMASGLVMGPCTAPVLAVLLGYVATQQNLFFAATFLLFLPSFGDISYHSWDICRSAGQSAQIGPWMVRITHLFGWILIGTGEYFLIQSGSYGAEEGCCEKRENFDFPVLGVIFLIFWIILSCSETSQSPISLKTVEGKARDFMLKT